MICAVRCNPCVRSHRASTCVCRLYARSHRANTCPFAITSRYNVYSCNHCNVIAQRPLLDSDIVRVSGVCELTAVMDIVETSCTDDVLGSAATAIADDTIDDNKHDWALLDSSDAGSTDHDLDLPFPRLSDGADTKSPSTSSPATSVSGASDTTLPWPDRTIFDDIETALLLKDAITKADVYINKATFHSHIHLLSWGIPAV